jgi:two-component system, chemotaxis family, sensor histidine kinase and response regulator PixL
MTISAQEQQVRLQFLEEAQDYVDQIETGLLGVGSGEVKGKQFDAVLRAAHSIKGGAAMMSFSTLAKIGHRLEDSIKVLRHGHKAEVVDGQLEKDLLLIVDRLRRVMEYNSKGQTIPPEWLATEVDPILDRLYEQLGEPQAADEAALLAEEDGDEDDIVVYLFESEVDSALQHLEEILSDSAQPHLKSELEITTETLNGLAEMIELPAMAALCNDIAHKLSQSPDQFVTIAELAVAAWRRSQSLVMIGHRDNLPTAIDFTAGKASPVITATVPELLIDSQPPKSTVDPAEPIRPESVELKPVIIDSTPELVVTSADYLFSLDNSSIFTDLDTITDHDNIVNDHLIGALGFANQLDQSEQKLDIDILNLDSLTDWQDGDGLFMPPVEPDFSLADNPPIVEKLFTTDDLLDYSTEDFSITDQEIAINFANSGSSPGSINIDELTTFEQTEAIDSSEMLPELTEQPVLEWVNNEAPPSEDFFSLINAIEIPGLAQNQADFLAALTFGDSKALEELSLDSAAAEPHAPFVPETYDQGPAAPDQMIRVSVNQLTMIGDLFGELNISRSGLNLQITGIRSLLQSLTDKVGRLETASSQLRHAYDQIATRVPNTSANQEVSDQNALTSDFDLLEMDRYGEFHLLSQAVIETVVQIQEKVTDIDIQLNETETVTRDISRTTQQMQNSFTGVRMLPFNEVVGRFPRAIREMSIEHGKQVDLVIKGAEILIERNVIEVLKDPLMHLLRNCFDHGIEAPADRLAVGKSATGKIEITAFYRGNQTVIMIQDDGKGMDLARIRAKALKMGIDEEMLNDTSEKELLDLIFEPGFSTAETVTDLSGRGVGMDVVRTNLQSAKGEIQIGTKAGQGSTFTITIPFTLSVIKVLIVDVNKMLFAFPVNAVEETLLPNPEQIVIRDGQAFLDWEEFQVQLINMAEYFKAPEFLPPLDFDITPKIDQPAIFLTADGDQLYGLQVDRFWNEQEVTVRQPQGVIPLPPGLSGSAILGDGRVVPLVDPLAVARWVTGHQNDIQTVDQDDDFAETTLEREQLVMVVDDSINVRRFVALTLERHGYRVEQAKDGQEAIEKIQAGIIPNLVICDLEMPRMDGYGFLANVKAIDHAKHVPVVMLTSRSGQKHRKIAMNLGAAAYYAKPFNEAEMLNTISELII